MSRVAGRAAGHRFKVGGWDTRGRSESKGRHLGSDHVENYDAMWHKLRKRRRFSDLSKWKRRKKVQIQLCCPGACEQKTETIALSVY